MRHEISDTVDEAERAHLELVRRASPARRLRLAFSLSRTVMELSRATLKRHANGSPEEAGLQFVSLNYGAELAAGVREALRALRR